MARHRPRLSLVALLGLSTLTLTVVYQVQRSLAPTNPVALLDRRSLNSVHDYSVIVASKETPLSGHAYVVWVEHPQNGEYRAHGVGFYASGAINARVLTGSHGQLLDEFGGSGSPGNTTSTLVVWVDREQFMASRRYADTWARDTRYAVMSRDCITFLEGVAHALGVSLPRRLRLLPPNAYLRSLLEHSAGAWAATLAALD